MPPRLPLRKATVRMTASQSTSPIGERDYATIEAALMDTQRGQSFLAEHARRQRAGHTTMLLAAIDRLEAVAREQSCDGTIARLREGLRDMSIAVARVRREVLQDAAGASASNVAAALSELEARVAALTELCGME